MPNASATPWDEAVEAVFVYLYVRGATVQTEGGATVAATRQTAEMIVAHAMSAARVQLEGCPA